MRQTRESLRNEMTATGKPTFHVKSGFSRFLLAVTLLALAGGTSCQRSGGERTARPLIPKSIEFSCQIYHVPKDSVKNAETLLPSDLVRLFNATKKEVGDIYVRQFSCEKPFMLHVANSGHTAWSWKDSSTIEARRPGRFVVTRTDGQETIGTLKDAFYAAFSRTYSEAGLLNVLRFFDASELEREFGANQPKPLNLQLNPDKESRFRVYTRLEETGTRHVFQDAVTGYVLFSVLVPPDELSSLPAIVPYPIIKRLEEELNGDSLNEAIKKMQDRIAREHLENKDRAEEYRSVPKLIEVERYRFKRASS